MSQAALIAFFVSFVGGPLLCVALLRVPGTVILLLTLAAGVVATMSAALWLEAGNPLTSLTLMWLGWVLAVAMVAHALRRRSPRRLHRWITVIAVLATPLPWFGLATARLMTQLPG